MVEIIRSITVSVEIDTNKATYSKTFRCGEGESLDELMERATEWAHDQLDD